MPAKSNAEHAADERAAAAPEVVPSEQAVPVPDAPAEHPDPQARAVEAPLRARFKGAAGEYLTPLLVAERSDPDNPDSDVVERIYYTPGRDLTDDEWAAMPAVQRDYIRSSRHYEVATDREIRAAKRAE